MVLLLFYFFGLTCWKACDLAAARAEAHEEWTEEAATLALKRLEEADMDVD